MGCLLAAFAGVFPRLGLFMFWILRPARVDAAFDTWILPLLGLIFLPFATLMYAVLYRAAASAGGSGSGSSSRGSSTSATGPSAPGSGTPTGCAATRSTWLPDLGYSIESRVKYSI